MDIRKILKKLTIIQEVSNEGRSPTLGRGYFTAQRYNPYNPLSYITLIVFLIIAIPLFGILGMMDLFNENGNPFKWN